MKIRLSRIGTIVLIVLLFPIVATLRLVRFLRRRGETKRVYRSSIDGDPLAYSGDRPLLIALWADWAHIWQVATHGIVEQLQREFAGRCEFAYVDASRPAVRAAYGTPVVPTLILRKRGAEIVRFVNVLKADEVKSAVAAAVAEPAHNH